jgi:bacteriocin-like protein
MGDQEQKQEPTSISPQPDAEKENKKKKSTELSEEELKKVSGGDCGPAEDGMSQAGM